MASRYAFVAALGVFPLAGAAVARLKPAWLRGGLALVLLFEVLPPPTSNVPARPAAPPAFEWLRAQDLAGDNILDLASLRPDHLAVLFGGEILYATLLHQQATVSGVGSYMPAHFLAIYDWFDATPHPLSSPELAPLLRFYHVRYVLVHMQGAAEQPLVADASSNAELRLVQCFGPPPGPSPWPYPICVLQVEPAANDRVNLIRGDGWSADEPWGTWLDSTQPTARWVATATEAQTLSLALLPICLPNRPQHVTLSVNSVVVAEHRWQNCDPWQTQVALPAAVTRVGWNSLTIQADFAAQPVDPASGQAVDSRVLSLAVTELHVQAP